MAKFNVGDLVVAIDGTGFTVTNEYALMKVVNPLADDFSAELVAHQSTKMKGLIGRRYDNLAYEDFEIATEEQIARINGESTTTKKKSKKDCKTVSIGPLEVSVYTDGRVESNFNSDFKDMMETDDK